MITVELVTEKQNGYGYSKKYHTKLFDSENDILDYIEKYNISKPHGNDHVKITDFKIK